MGRTIRALSQRGLTPNRREAIRYDIPLNLRFAVPRRGSPPITGSGQSVNVSRTGLLFRSDGGRIQLTDSIITAIDWPVTAPAGEAMFLVMIGYVVRVKRLMVAVSTSDHRLLRASELDKRLDAFFGPAAFQPSQEIAEKPLVLVDGDQETTALVADMVGPERRTRRTDPVGVRYLLGAGSPAVALVVTSSVELLDSLPPDLPIILLVDEDATGLRDQWSHLPNLVVVNKPLTGDALSGILDLLLGTSAVHQKRVG